MSKGYVSKNRHKNQTIFPIDMPIEMVKTHLIYQKGGKNAHRF
jgi:hypothetical protein